MIPCDKKLKVVIPARGGSKGVPRKNIKILNGRPLIAYPILEALNCKNVSKVYVSTDNEEISRVAKSYGATIINRPSEFATDSALDIDVMRHVVNYLGDFGDIVHLRATTPMIKSAVVDKAIEAFLNKESCTSLRSAHECPETAYKYFEKDNLYWRGLFDDKLQGDYYNNPRQSLILDNVEIVLACTSTYPTTPSEVNLKHIQTLKINYPQLKVGFSNHYSGLDASVGAVALGAECVEFHITNDRTSYGSDQSASIENSHLLISAIRNMEVMLGDGIKQIYESEVPIAKKLRKVDDTL